MSHLPIYRLLQCCYVHGEGSFILVVSFTLLRYIAYVSTDASSLVCYTGIVCTMTAIMVRICLYPYPFTRMFTPLYYFFALVVE